MSTWEFQNYLLYLAYPLGVVLSLLMVDKKVNFSQLKYLVSFLKLIVSSIVFGFLVSIWGSLEDTFSMTIAGIPLLVIAIPLILCLTILPILFIGYRFNDIGKSHWWGLLCLFPPITPLLIIVLGLVPSKDVLAVSKP